MKSPVLLKHLLITMPIGVVLLLQQFLATVSTPVSAQPDPSCRERCGHLQVPYPFGMDSKNCSMGEKFLISCDETFQSPRAFLEKSHIRVTNISLDGELTITQRFVAHDCYDKLGRESDNNWGSYRIWLPSYSISSTKNKFVAIGCDTNAFVQANGGEERYATGCISFCSSANGFNESCTGKGCCQTSIASGLKDITVKVFSYYNHSGILDFNPCSYAFVVEESKFNFSLEMLQKLDKSELPELPMAINWAIGDDNKNDRCDQAKNRVNYACKLNSECIDVNDGSGGYRCKCLQGYEGNPYSSDGCRDIDECLSSNNRCHRGRCNNLPGTWECICPERYTNNGTACNNGDQFEPERLLLFYIALGISLTLLVAISVICWGMKKMKLSKLKKKFFEQNGGLMLQQGLSNFEAAKIFSAEELERATNDYNENRVIGEGGFGKVYKGILPDNQEVAIKKSKIGDQSQTAQFINEVMILLQINHRNVVKLLGCCLETEVPSLVYKFIKNGTLFQHIHKKGKASALPWKLRLKIASETAGALAYLHSATSTPITHRDVKTSNILLDENYVAKVADFGASKLIPIDQNQLTTLVRGALGYLDPEYFHTSQLTEKSDVYSFGVVLAELLTSKEVVSFNRPEGERNLAIFFVRAVEEDCLLHVLDGDIVNEVNVEEVKKVANLAKMCLSVKGEERPTMKEVANELEELINSEKHPWRRVDLHGEETEYLLGPPSNSYGNSGGESGFRSSVAEAIGYDSMQSQMLSHYDVTR